MHLEPINQIKLYGLSNFFWELSNLFDQQKLPNKILLSGKKGIGKATLAFHLTNYILSINEDNSYNKNELTINKTNRAYTLVNNHSHPNFYLIDILKDKKNIDINQVRKLILFANKSSFNNGPKVILLDNIEFLNNNSVNALLKIIEEPNDNLFFILINNNTKVFPTLFSRCINFKLNLSFNEAIIITNHLLKKNILDLIHIDLVNYYNTPGDYYNLVRFANDNKFDLTNLNWIDFLKLLIDKNFIKTNVFIKYLILNYIELLILKKYTNSKSKSHILNLYFYFINKINNCYKFNLDEESLYLEFKSKMLNE